MNPWQMSTASFAGLNQGDILGYLKANGWALSERLSDRALVFVAPGGGEVELLVPARPTVGDYAARMAEVVSTLAHFEQRPAISVLSDLQMAGSDVIRLRASAPSAGQGDDSSLPLMDGVALVEAGRNLLLSAACAAVAPWASFHLGKVARANDYLRGVRLGQSERGSYVITLLSPVDPAFPSQEGLPGLEAEPFARRVTRTLAGALDRLRDAVVAGQVEGFAAFESAVPHGISANLCEAAAELIEHGNGLMVGVHWARTRPGPPDPGKSIRFSPADAGPLRSAVLNFRAREPEPDHELIGYITTAARELRDFDGQVSLATIVDNQRRRISMKLAESEFALALRAMNDKSPIAVVGDLIKSGARMELLQPRQLRVLEPSDSGADESGN